MSRTSVRVLSSPHAIGEHLAQGLLGRIEQARQTGKRFVLGCPTGRTPRPVYEALARQLAESPQDLSHLVLVMMDEYLVPSAGDQFEYVSSSELWSCHHFARIEIADRLNEGLPASHRVSSESIWFPDPRDPEAYDARIARAGGIDLFILASGASDGHVAFNPPGSTRESRTRIIPLSEETRRDNLLTFPTFGALAAVPSHGISVGIDTIASAKESVMIVWGAAKRTTLARMLSTEDYDPEWPATVIHECAVREILSDATASGDGVGAEARGDGVAAELRGFGPLGILAILVILAGNAVFRPLSAILVLAWRWRSHTPWREIGYVRPSSWIRSAMAGIAFGIAFEFLMKAIVMRLLGAPPVNPAYHYLAGNRDALPGAIFAMIVFAGFGEETVFRGYMFERLGKLFGSGAWAKTLIVLLTAGLFAGAHYAEQGLAGVELATITGLVFGTIFALTGRIWMLMFAHAAFDLTAVAIIYWNLESTVAHLIFR